MKSLKHRRSWKRWAKNAALIVRKKGGHVRHHYFPVKQRPTVCRLWELATKIPNFRATATDNLCSSHFHPDAYKFSSSHLKEDAVPSIFEPIPSLDINTNKKESKKRPAPRIRELTVTPPSAKHQRLELDDNTHVQRCLLHDLKEQLQKKDEKLAEYQSKVKHLKQQVRRKEVKVQNLQSIIATLK